MTVFNMGTLSEVPCQKIKTCPMSRFILNVPCMPPSHLVKRVHVPSLEECRLLNCLEPNGYFVVEYWKTPEFEKELFSIPLDSPSGELKFLDEFGKVVSVMVMEQCARQKLIEMEKPLCYNEGDSIVWRLYLSVQRIYCK